MEAETPNPRACPWRGEWKASGAGSVDAGRIGAMDGSALTSSVRDKPADGTVQLFGLGAGVRSLAPFRLPAAAKFLASDLPPPPPWFSGVAETAVGLRSKSRGFVGALPTEERTRWDRIPIATGATAGTYQQIAAWLLAPANQRPKHPFSNP